MVMNKNLQVSKLKKMVGTNSDLFDFKSEVDGRLSYEENRNKIIKKLKKLGLLKKDQENKLKWKAGDLFLKAREIHKKRSILARSKDSERNAVKTFDSSTLTKKQFLKWKKNPNSYDILGIDTKGEGRKFKPKKSKKMSIKEIESLFDSLD